MQTNQAVVAAKIETSYGIDAVPTGTEAVGVFDFSPPDITGDLIERDLYKNNNSLSPIVIGKKIVEGSFKMEVKGAGAVYSAIVKPEIDPILRAAGFSSTLDDGTPGAEKYTYAPVSSGYESMTLYIWVGGILHKIPGCHASVKLLAEAGKRAVFNVTYKGLFVAPVDMPIISPTLSSVLPPIVENAGLSLGAYANGIYTKFELDVGVEIKERLDVNSPEGLWGVQIRGRKPSASIDPLAVTEATKPFWDNWKNGTQEALSITIGSTLYNRIVVSAPAVQMSSVKWGDSDGERSYDLPIRPCGVTGDDEFSLLFS